MKYYCHNYQINKDVSTHNRLDDAIREFIRRGGERAGYIVEDEDRNAYDKHGKCSMGQ